MSDSESKLQETTKLFKHWGERIRALKRGMLGLPIDEDAFNGMIDVKKTEERTRVTIEEQYWRTFVRSVGEVLKIPFLIWMASELDSYGIALEGKQWDAWIQMKTMSQPINVQPIAVPQQARIPESKDQKKEGKT
jgi:hypothetical protein